MADSNGRWKAYKEAVLTKISDYSVLYEGVAKQKPASDGWISGRCPFHDDKEPSFGFNRNTGRWCCFAGCGKGGPIDFLMHSSGFEFKDALVALGDRLGVERPYPKKSERPQIGDDLVTKWAEYLQHETAALRWLRDERGLTDSTITQYEIGWEPKRQRYTIPVRDERGNIVNVRLYSRTKKPKMQNYTDGEHKYGSPPRLYGLDTFVKANSKEVTFCEGEWDRLLLAQEGFVAVTGTHGAATFRPEWLPHFKGKHVVILYDCDKEGQDAAKGVALHALATAGAASIKNVALPLSGDKTEKDVTDYFVKCGHTAEDLRTLINGTPVHAEAIERAEDDVVDLDSFVEIEREEHTDKKVRCDITVCGETSEAFHAVEEFQLSNCDGQQKGQCYECIGFSKPATLPRGAQEYIGSCMSSNFLVKAMLRDYACKHGDRPFVEILKRTTIKEFFCHQRVNRITHTRDENGNVVQVIDGRQQELVEKRVYYLSHEHPKPGSYRAIGWVKSHPKTQQVTLLIESLEPLEDDFESFRVEGGAELLRAFRAIPWSEMLDDLTKHVTRVYERDELLIAILLAYCSPRWVPFNGEIIRGWLIVSIVGDSGSGKTQTYSRIAEFVNVGDTFSGLTGSRTGLAYALSEHKQKGWQVKIGRYPANSRKILCVDETQHIPEWELRTISKGMEDGFFQIDRVQSKGYESQTRLIMIANPKKDIVMDSFSFGCEALATIFPPTMIRRTDIAVFTNSGDLHDLSFINRAHAEPGSRRISPEMLRTVIFWAWNLRPEQITFTPDAEAACLSLAEELSQIYGYAVNIPLITRSDCRKTIARIAAAFAVLQVSATGDFTQLIVERSHVSMAVGFLGKLYSHQNCGLDEYSRISRLGSEISDYDAIREAFLEKRENEKHAAKEKETFPAIVFLLYTTKSIRREDLAEQAGCSEDTVKRAVKLLKRFNLIDSFKEGYVKKPRFNKFLRRFSAEESGFFETVPGAGFNSSDSND